MNDSPFTLNRRDLLALTVAAGAGSVLGSTGRAEEEKDSPFRIIDTNVSLFHWPFRRLPLDNTNALVKKLRSLGITQAWAGSFEGLLHRDQGEVNLRLAKRCATNEELIPIGSVNPTLPDWDDDLRRCFEEYHMPGVRLHPNYHGYALDDPAFVQLLKLATEAGRFVQIAAAMEDTRTHYALVRVPDVDLAPLADVASRIRGVRVQILNHRVRAPLLTKLTAVPGIYFDTARVEGTDGVPQFVDAVPPGRVMFGSHAPFLIPESALIRVHESNRLEEDALRAVLAGNAAQFLENTGR